MSVYTTLTGKEFSALLTRYSLGKLIRFEGIQAGIENTNYFIYTTRGKYVFTLFETLQRQQLDFYVSLLDKLSTAGIACPQPQHDLKQQIINEIKGKPFIIVSRLQGSSPSKVILEQCKAIATELARLHITELCFPNPVMNRRGMAWLETMAQHLSGSISVSDAQLIHHELSAYQTLDESLLPRGIIHADLFRDNALFVGNQLSGIIDLYDACYDTLLLDVAITVNDWCITSSGSLNHDFYTAFMEEYQVVRPFTTEEKCQWNLTLRRAAMRFWLSRLEAKYNPRPGDLTQAKDPGLFKNILLFHIQHENVPQENQTSRKIRQLP